jgi:coenzyme F420-reducing hydrogenase beta subunit
MSKEINRKTSLSTGELYCGYANNPDIRDNAASGGIVTQILVHSLESGLAQKVLVSRLGAQQGSVRGISEWVESPEGVCHSSGSSYVYTPVIEKIHQLQPDDGPVGVVALPCQVQAIRKLQNRRPHLQQQIAFVVSLFCRGTLDNRFYDYFLARHGICPAEVARIQVRRRHVGGKLEILMNNGKKQFLPFFAFNTYRVAGIDAHFGCLRCTEHLGQDADIAVGDIYSKEYKKLPIKHSAYIPWTDRGRTLLQQLVDSSAISCKHYGLEHYREQFKKLEHFSNTIEARQTAAKIVKVKGVQARWRYCRVTHVLSWVMFFAAFRLSRSKKTRPFVFRTPSVIVKLWALSRKILSKL